MVFEDYMTNELFLFVFLFTLKRLFYQNHLDTTKDSSAEEKDLCVFLTKPFSKILKRVLLSFSHHNVLGSEVSRLKVLITDYH